MCVCFVFIDGWMHKLDGYILMYLCIYVCMYVCKYVCVNIYIHVNRDTTYYE